MHDTRFLLIPAAAFGLLLLGGCGRNAEDAGPKFGTETIGRRDIVVAVEAAGTVEPLLTVEIKSKASGEVLKVNGETGQLVQAGTLLVQIDKRTPRNLLSQAQAALEAAIARRSIAQTQEARSRQLVQSRTINEVDYEKSQLELANAKADVVSAQVAVENARITLDDTDVRAPITGTIIEKLVETGQVISSPMKDFGGGTSLMKMADLTTVQVRALVDETDVGKIEPGKPVTVKVTAYPNQPFPGEVYKIEPQAKQDQSVTTFAVLIRLPNPQGLLRPGMNADVEIKVAERHNVLAVPTVALRTPREIGTDAAAMGLDEAAVRRELGDGLARAGGQGAGSSGYEYGGHYWTFVRRDGKPVAVNVETGITDLEFSEVLAGLREGDAVFMLPSTGLLEQQARGREMMRRFSVMPTGGAKKPAGKPGQDTKAGQADKAGQNGQPAATDKAEQPAAERGTRPGGGDAAR
ncbi:MAG: efflux RND transporter periplasmic adaptor subunit [Gammaproteobacteria bacterium]|nr:efflux RND transporter periplasmic adaptor subunit [Gammaproteobacteria bacterium]